MRQLERCQEKFRVIRAVPLAEFGNMRAVLTAVLFFGFLAGCNNSNAIVTPTPSAPTVTGTWSGPLTFEGQTATMTWTLTQTGSSVSGPARVALPNGIVLLNGQLTGTLTGSTMTYSIAVAQGGVPAEPACSGRLDGSVAVTQGATSTMTGSYTVGTSSCKTNLTGGNFTLTR